MFEKIKNLPNHELLQNFRDIRFLGFLVFAVLVLLASWSGVNVIETNFDLQKQIAQIDQQDQVSQLENVNLKLQNEYYNTDTYLELTARKQFGKGAPGEKLLLVPKEVALAHAPQLPEDKQAAVAIAKPTDKPAYRQHFDDWMDFFLRRGS
ncbi:MAG TPA: septum formation initiator family protein [Patescibacteria group bacterium]|nr:septum formation initiator family protein [Patescibacteria group bacterium]